MNSTQGKRPIAEKVQQPGCTTDTLGDIGWRILLADELMRLHPSMRVSTKPGQVRTSEREVVSRFELHVIPSAHLPGSLQFYEWCKATIQCRMAGKP